MSNILASGGLSMSKFSSETWELRQLLQETVIFNVLEIKWLAGNITPFSSSKRTCN